MDRYKHLEANRCIVSNTANSNTSVSLNTSILIIKRIKQHSFQLTKPPSIQASTPNAFPEYRTDRTTQSSLHQQPSDPSIIINPQLLPHLPRTPPPPPILPTIHNTHTIQAAQPLHSVISLSRAHCTQTS